MAAIITLSAVALAADGKTITATIGGGAGGYAITTTAGLTPHVNPGTNFGNNAFGISVASATVSGSTLTVVCQTPIGTGETAQLDIAASSTLTDSSANTPTGQTNLTVTNSSAVTVLSIDLKTQASKFEISALAVAASAWNNSQLTQTPDNWPIEFVSDATEVAVYSYSGTTSTYRKDNDAATSTASSITGFWSAKALTNGPLAAGKHMWLVNPGQYFFGVRLSGGTRSMDAVPTTKQTVRANTSGLLAFPASTVVKTAGAFQITNAANGTITNSTYGGTEVDVGFTGSGIEVCSLSHVNNDWAASIDGGQYGALTGIGTATINNVTDWLELAKGLTSAAHTLRAILVSVGSASSTYAVRVINGTALTASAASSATSIQVASVSTIAVNDWVKIDAMERREWRQVTSISGTGPYTLAVAALTNAHASGVAVTSYSAPAGSLATFNPTTYTKRVAAFGDSNTAGANIYGLVNNAPDSFGNWYAFYDARCDPINLVCGAAPATWPPTQQLGYEVVNMGVQGQSTAQIVARATDAASGAYGRGSGFDFITLWPGTNDINSLTTTPAAYQTSLQTFVTNAATYLNAGGMIVLIAPNTPQGVTNSGGLNIAACQSACAAIAAANPSNTIYAVNASYNLTQSTDIIGGGTGLHLTPAGQTKVAQNLLQYLGVAMQQQSMMLALA